ncbi:ShlB/FhaC/HecB family hemolysin secretion/activation protein [Salmonella enterica subsp. salamae]|nr:ShlB/FhaC/HecB family hemolysin secretion/activation protein [Salmonella enterica subsp. salamae]
MITLTPLACLVSVSVWAAPAPAPDAGALGNQLRQMSPVPVRPLAAPPLTLPADTQGHAVAPVGEQTHVTLKKIVFTGDISVPGIRLLSEARLLQIVRPWVDRPLSFQDIQTMAGAVTQYYRQQGVILARAIIPPQTVKDGVLTVRILTGRYDKSDIHNATTLRTPVVQRIVSATTPEGDVVRQAQLERVALLLNEIPGVEASVALKAGTAAGTSAPDINVKPGKRAGGYVGLDNQGDPATGRSRVMVGGYVNNLTGLGDQLRVDILDAWEKSDLFNGSLDYSLPVGGYGTRVGAGYSHLNYHYNFEQQGFNGYSDNWLLYVTQPWVRTARARVDVRLDGGQQFLTDKYPSRLFGEAMGSEGRKQVSLGGLDVNGSVASTPGGLSGFDLRATVGNVDYRNDVARLMGFSEEAGTAGEFARLNYQVNHDQQLSGPFSLYASLNGQMANHNLDTSQKFLLGGPSAVRAYDIGDGSVDNGNVLTAELRSHWAVPVQRWLGVNPGLTVAAFYDQGWGQQYGDNRNQATTGDLTDHNRVSLAGAGLYATVSDAGNYALTMTWARRTGDADPVSGHDDRDRFWISAIKTF